MSKHIAGRIAGARNLVVGAALALVADAARRAHKAGQRWPHVDAGAAAAVLHPERSHSAVAHSSDCTALLEREVSELALLADQIYGVADLARLEDEARHEDEVGEDTFVRLDDLRWILGSYVLKGGRIRRLAQLSLLLESLAGEAEPEHSAGNVGDTAAELLRRIRDTNSVTVDWLLLHRVALPDPDFLDSNALLDRYDRIEIEPTTVSGDPLYLLTCHIHDMLETTESLGTTDHSVLERLEVQLAKPVIAIENEIKAAMAFDTALLSAARHVVGAADAV